MAYDDRGMVRWNGDQASSRQLVPKRIVRMYNGSGADIAAKQCVAIDKTVETYGKHTAIKLSDNADLLSQCGGSVALIEDGTWGEVQVEGIQEGVAVADAVTEGQLLVQDPAGNDGRLVATPAGMTSDDQVIVAMAASDGAADNTGTVQWMNPFRL